MLRAVSGNNGGGGGGTATGFAVTVATYADLPAASTLTGQDAQVLTTTGVPFVNRRMKGIYYSDGAQWIYVGPIDTDEDSQIQVSAGQRWLGRYSATAGTVQEGTYGTGLSLNTSTGVLTATGLGGDVVGPASSTDNAFARFDGTTGKLIQNSSGTLDDSGNATLTTLNLTAATSQIVFDSDGTFTGTFTMGALSGNRIWTMPNSTGTVCLLANTATISNKTLDNTNTATLKDTLFTLQDDGDATKLLAFQLSGITTGNTRTVTIQDSSGTMAYLGNNLGSFAATTSAQLASVISDETGSGSLVFATSPTLVTPNIGAATGTSLQLSALTASSAVATDGSKNLVSVTNTGTGNNVLATSPTLTTPIIGTAFANAIVFSPTASPSYTAGKLVYDSDNESLTFFNNDSLVSLQIGQEEWIRVKNVTGSSIPNGSAVYINGASAGLPTIALAQANSGSTVIGAGLATETIANNTIGYITCIGVVHGLDTSAFSAGATVFISSTVAGGLVSTAPTAPNFRYRIGIVAVSDATVGSIHVTPSTAALGNGTANQLFGMNTAGTAQELKSLVAGTNVTITPGTNTITIAASGGGGADISWFGTGADGNVTISSGVTTATRDMYYNNLTISGTGQLNVGSNRIFVSGILDITAAPANAIVGVASPNGGAASGATGGTGGTVTSPSTRTIALGSTGVAGATGTSGAGASTAANVGQNFFGGFPGGGGNGEKGGNSTNAGGTQATNTSIQTGAEPRFPSANLSINLATLFPCGQGGPGGASGGGDGTNNGGGGGGGGSSASPVAIYANTISRGAGTAAGCIASIPGNGGNGAQSGGGANRSGGMGGCGGAGGMIYILFATLTGSSKAGALTSPGGNGGNGGPGLGTGTGGYGGPAGKAGIIILVQLGVGVTASLGTRTNAPVALAGGANSGVTGGTGATGETLTATL